MSYSFTIVENKPIHNKEWLARNKVMDIEDYNLRKKKKELKMKEEKKRERDKWRKNKIVVADIGRSAKTLI